MTRDIEESGVSLVCFPFAGGNSQTFRGWQSRMPEHVTVLPVELPGRLKRFRTAPLESVEAIVDDVLVELGGPSKPFAVFGHSMGALLAFEYVRSIRAHYGIEPVHLFVSGRSAPDAAPSGPQLHDLPGEQLLLALAQSTQVHQVLLQNADLREVMLPLLRADLRVCESYRYREQPPLSCPITAYVGQQDSGCSRYGLMGWKRHTTNAFRTEGFPGAHQYIETNRNAVPDAVARVLSTPST